MPDDMVNRYIEDNAAFYYFTSLKEINYCLPYSSKLVSAIPASFFFSYALRHYQTTLKQQ